jgi:hypothetical protein
MLFLNNAAESPLNTRFRHRLEDYLQLADEAPQNKPGVRTLVRQRLSELLGGAPEDEHWNNTFPWLALKNWGG